MRGWHASTSQRTHEADVGRVAGREWVAWLSLNFISSASRDTAKARNDQRSSRRPFGERLCKRRTGMTPSHALGPFSAINSLRGSMLQCL